MYEIYKKNVTIERLRTDEENLKCSKKESYLISYPHFLKYFNDLDTITLHNLVIGIHFTYGWMPTAFDFRSEEFDDAVKILQSAKSGNTPNQNELVILKGLFNNSLVGTSKILHFINPKKFAIWDSKVFKYLTHTSPHQYRMDNIDYYLDYLKFCTYITNKPEIKCIKESVESKLWYPISYFRAVEIIMFKGKTSS